MVMGRRPDVPTAPAAVSAVDTLLLVQQLGAALVRVPFRDPLEGHSTVAANVTKNVTREVIRAFMGFTSSLPVDEFRSVEMLLDDLCRVVMPPIVRSFDVDAVRTRFGGVPGILHTPRGIEPEGVIVYLHGGGYIGTSPTMYSFFTARLCRETRCAVFVADYRLAPEFPFPAGVEDAAAVVNDLVDRGLPPERLLIAGDSGGGGLANSLLLCGPAIVEAPRPAGLILFSPEVDLLLDEDSVTENAPKDILPWNIPTASYLHGADASDASITVINADLADFPPTFVAWGDNEMFRDAIRRFVARLEQAGVPHDGREAPGMFHVFPILMPWADESRRTYGEVGAFVARVLDGAPPLPADLFDVAAEAAPETASEPAPEG